MSYTYFKCSDILPDNDRHVMIYSHGLFGQDWHPAKWKGDKWEFVGFEDETDEEFRDPNDVTHWMEMPFDKDKANLASNGLPDTDRYVLILAESHFGPGIWHSAAWLGEDTWAILGLGYSESEINATHWLEMPPAPVS